MEDVAERAKSGVRKLVAAQTLLSNKIKMLEERMGAVEKAVSALEGSSQKANLASTNA